MRRPPASTLVLLASVAVASTVAYSVLDKPRDAFLQVVLDAQGADQKLCRVRAICVPISVATERLVCMC